LKKRADKRLKITVIRKNNKNNEPVYLEYKKRIIYSRKVNRGGFYGNNS
jgi:hypothetical protein